MCKGPEVGVGPAHLRNSKEPDVAGEVSKGGRSRRRGDLRDGSWEIVDQEGL